MDLFPFASKEKVTFRALSSSPALVLAKVTVLAAVAEITP